MINCVALDDEPLALDLIKEYCKDIPFVHLAAGFVQPSKAKAYIEFNPCDLLFLDIQMPDISGLNFLKNLKNPPMVIFATAYKEHAVEGFTLNAIDYLLKPFSPARFHQALTKAYEHHIHFRVKEDDDYVYVYSEYRLLKIPAREIVYIEGMDDYVRIHLADNTKIMSLTTMKAIMEKLPPGRFLRIHRSFIVQAAKINNTKGNMMWIDNIKLPIGSTYKKEVTASFVRSI